MKNQMPIDKHDLVDLQIYAARYAHNRRSVSTYALNSITEKLIKAGYNLIADTTRDAPEPTVWVMDGDFGWPMDLVEKYGWDGRKQPSDVQR
jgi:hypothetical protein